MMHSHYVVVGAGLAGAATAWQLARRGHEVTLLERARPATPDGSSHGSARIFRYPYLDGLYTDLVIRSRAAFDELEQLDGRELITTTGAFDFGAGRDLVALGASLSRAGVEHVVLSRDEARARHPGIAFDTDVLWHPGAGVLDAETVVHALVSAAVASGADLRTNWAVREVAATAAGLLVRATDGRTLDARHVVVAAGGWLPTILPRLPPPPRTS